jgi:diaminopimelate decarboxylase
MFSKLETVKANYSGATYVYSKQKFVENFTNFQSAISENFTNFLICFSIKSCSNETLIKNLLQFENAGIDCVSIGEVKKALSVGFPVKKLVFAGVGKEEEELEFAIQNNILQINVESKEELLMIQEISEKLNKKVDVALRINPNLEESIEYTNKKITTGKKENKFGIDVEEFDEAMNVLKNCPNVNLIGLTCHVGSQILDLSIFETGFKTIANLTQNLISQGFQIKTINLGGGVGIAYSESEVAPNLSQYSRLAFESMKNIPNLGDVKIIFEPGRIISGSSGILLAKVILVKETRHKKFLILNAGMNDLIRPSMYNAFHEIIPLDENFNKLEIYDVVGPVCESGDVFVKNYQMPEVKKGDFIIIKNAGAYGFVMSSSYNQRKLPSEIVLDSF